MSDPAKLRELASWYREFAERTENTVIWEGRLRMAEDLEDEAERLEGRELQTGSECRNSKAARENDHKKGHIQHFVHAR
jgi:hypothetical protein